MKIHSIFSIVAMLCSVALSGLTLTVRLDGSAQFTSIQSAVEAASNGDIVLVYPGRYCENVDFLDKSIAINSLEASTGDSTYIGSTIIDGGRQAPCVSFQNGLQNASIRGFTLTNGLGALHFTTHLSVGGGILIYNNCNVTVTNCDVWGNYALIGAGLILYKSSAVFSGLKIHHNYAASTGGGMLIWGHQTYYPNIVFDPNNLCSIYENYGGNPTDIEIVDIHQNLQVNLDMGSVENPTEFYIQRTSNFTVTSGYHDTINHQRTYRTEVDHDLWVSPDGNDANSGLDPSQPLRSITLAVHSIQADSLNIHTVHLLPGTFSSDDQTYPIPLKSFVNMIGTGSGSSIILYDEYNALLGANVIGSQKLTNTMLSGFTIRSGLNPDLITIFPLYIGKFFVDSEVTDVVIEGFHIYRSGIILKPVRTNFTQMTIRNCTTAEVALTTYNDWVSGTLKDCVFENIESLNTGDPEYLRTVIDLWVEEQVNIENCVFRDIRVQDQQMIFHVSNSRQDNQPVNIVINNTVFENLRHNGKSPIIFGNNNVDSYTVSNCTFVDNFGTYGVIGTGGKLIFRNNIMHNSDAPKEMYIHNTFPEGYLSYMDLDYNLIRGGISSISNPWGNTLVYGQNNIDADPLFESTSIDDPLYLRLSASSPCINTGTPDISALYLPPYDLAGNWRVWNGRIDMGCYEYGSEPWVANDDPEIPALPEGISILVYPNPIIASASRGTAANIEFTLAKKPRAIPVIDIYNIRGQKVKTIQVTENNNSRIRKGGLSVEEKQTGEFYFTTWNGKGDANQNLSSGTYIIRVTADGASTLKKVTLIQEH